MKISLKNQTVLAFFFVILLIFCGFPLRAEISVKGISNEFRTHVVKEIKKMREGARGPVLQGLIERLDQAEADTIILPLTRDDETWHPNDRKGIRSHVVAQDVKVRGAARLKPTKAVFYLHPSRINPRLSTFKVGTFAHQLAEAMDLNMGVFLADYQVRARRLAFYQNAWRDSVGVPLLEAVGELETLDYQLAKEKDEIIDENKELFPIIDFSRPVEKEENIELSLEDSE